MFSFPAQQKLPYDSPVLQASPWIALLFGALMLWRLSSSVLAVRSGASTESLTVRLRREFATRVWSPRGATTVIGITFFFMLLLVGAWAYTDVLAEFARGMAGSLVARTLLLVRAIRRRNGGRLHGGTISQHARRLVRRW